MTQFVRSASVLWEASHVLLAPAPSLQRLLGFHLVRHFLWYYEPVRLLCCVHVRLSVYPSRTGLFLQTQQRSPGSRAESVSACLGSLTTPDRPITRRLRNAPCCLPHRDRR